MPRSDDRTTELIGRWDEWEWGRRPERIGPDEGRSREFLRVVLARAARAEAAERAESAWESAAGRRGLSLRLAGEGKPIGWMIATAPVFWAMASGSRAALVVGVLALAVGALVERAGLARQGREN